MSVKTENRNVFLCQHNISYYYDDDQKIPEHEEEHVKDMIRDGYRGGELNCLMPDDSENRGWWSIVKA